MQKLRHRQAVCSLVRCRCWPRCHGGSELGGVEAGCDAQTLWLQWLYVGRPAEPTRCLLKLTRLQTTGHAILQHFSARQILSAGKAQCVLWGWRQVGLPKYHRTKCGSESPWEEVVSRVPGMSGFTGRVSFLISVIRVSQMQRLRARILEETFQFTFQWCYC